MRGSHTTEKGDMPLKSEPLYKGPLPGVGAVPLGNQLTNNVGAGGPGAGRTLYGQSGSQKMHGSPAPGYSPPRKDILSDYGPEINKSRR